MTHYIYFVGHPKLRAKLLPEDKDIGTAWVVEYRSTWQSNDWKETYGLQMSLDVIEARIDCCVYLLEFE